MDLQTAFYIIGIVYMSLMLIIMIAIVIGVFVIKSKLDAVHRKIDEKLSIFTNIAHTGADVVNRAKAGSRAPLIARSALALLC